MSLEHRARAKWPLQRECNEFYGNPDPEGSGVPSQAWEQENLVPIVPPYRMYLAWDTRRVVKSFRIHRKVEPTLSRVMQKIFALYGSDQAVENARMHLFGGSYNFRMMRGTAALSMHSWGCAIDLDPANNNFGRRWRGDSHMMPMEVVTIFEQEGFTWGGRWRRPDPMHFQAARIK